MYRRKAINNRIGLFIQSDGNTGIGKTDIRFLWKGLFMLDIDKKMQWKYRYLQWENREEID